MRVTEYRIDLHKIEFGPSQALRFKQSDLLVPVVLVTMVLPICRMVNIDGALTSYQSFLVKGSTLIKTKKSYLPSHNFYRTTPESHLHIKHLSEC